MLKGKKDNYRHDKEGIHFTQTPYFTCVNPHGWVRRGGVSESNLRSDAPEAGGFRELQLLTPYIIPGPCYCYSYANQFLMRIE